MEPYLLGIDIGTGSTKSIAVSYDGEAFSVVQVHYPTKSPGPGLSEQDPEIIFNAFKDCVHDHIEKLKHPPAAIALSSAMHSVIAVDRDGKPLADLITWADNRSADIATRIKESAIGETIYKNTGTPIHAMSPLCKITWLRENKPELFARTYKFVSIKEYIWFKLFGEFKVDVSIASATGLLNIESLRWDNLALETAGITEEHLSVPTKADYSRNNPNETITNLASEVPFIIGGSDGCLANLGSFVFKENEAAVTIGTSGAVRISSSKPTHDYEAMTFNYRLDSDTFISGGPINNGGIVLQWFLKNILKKANLTPTDYEELFEDISKVEAGANGVVFLPYLHGERAPIWDTKSCGTFFGVKAYHTTAHFSKAIIEGICYALNNVLETLDGNGDKITRLHVSGGFVTSKIWLQILADITGKRVCVINTEDASAIGAAYFALKTSGVVEDYDTLLANRNMEFIEPSKTNHSIYRNYFIIYKNLYQTLKDQMHLLYNLNHS